MCTCSSASGTSYEHSSNKKPHTSHTGNALASVLLPWLPIPPVTGHSDRTAVPSTAPQERHLATQHWRPRPPTHLEQQLFSPNSRSPAG